MLGPVAATPAFGIGEYIKNPLEMYLSDLMTTGASVVGVPAISVPCGEVGDLPVGLQLMAPQGKDAELLQLAAVYEEIRNG